MDSRARWSPSTWAATSLTLQPGQTVGYDHWSAWSPRSRERGVLLAEQRPDVDGWSQPADIGHRLPLIDLGAGAGAASDVGGVCGPVAGCLGGRGGGAYRSDAEKAHAAQVLVIGGQEILAHLAEGNDPHTSAAKTFLEGPGCDLDGLGP